MFFEEKHLLRSVAYNGLSSCGLAMTLINQTPNRLKQRNLCYESCSNFLRILYSILIDHCI